MKLGRWFAVCVCLGFGLAWAAPNPGPGAKTDWPQFRGPKRDDVSTEKGLLKKWPDDGPPLLWSTKGLGSGFSSLAIAGDRIYTLGNGKGGVTNLLGLKRANGEQIWAVELGKAGGSLGCTPTVDGDNVYALGQEGDLICAKSATGEIVWRKNFKSDFGGKCGGWKYCESPLIDGEKLVCTPGAPDAIVVALNKATGELVWKSPSPFKNAEAGYSSLVITEVGGVKQYVQLSAGGVFGVAAKDGAGLWKYEKLGNNTANIPTPIVFGDFVFTSAGYGKGAALLKLTSNTKGETMAEEVYFTRDLTNKHGGIVMVGDHVYGDRDDSGFPQCAEVKTGKVVWKKKERGSGSGSAAVTYADGMLYFFYDNGAVSLVEANPAEYKEVSSFKVTQGGGQGWAHPVVLDGKLFIRRGDALNCYDVKQK